MKNILVAGFCSIALSTGVNAEDSAFFAGVSYQSGKTHFIETSDNKSSPTENFDKVSDIYGAGIKIGYKQFFGQSKWFGLRYYAFLDYGYSDFGNFLPDLKSLDADVKEKYDSHLFSYGVGIDTLWNVVNAKNASFGIFGGVGLGADTWLIGGKNFHTILYPKGKTIKASFQTTIDAGVRGNFYKHHGIEIGIKVPLLRDKVFQDLNDSYKTRSGNMTTVNVTTTMKRNYSLYLGYIYSF